MAGKDEVSFLFKCVKEGKITGDEAINIIGKGRSSATTGAIMRYGPNHSIQPPTPIASKPASVILLHILNVVRARAY